MGKFPWLELIHPGGTGLNDLELHVFHVPVAVGPSNDVASFQIRCFNVSEGNLLVAMGQNAIKMLFHHACKLLVGLQTAPLKLVYPSSKELKGPGPGGIRPQVVKRFFQQVGLEQSLIGSKKLVQCLPCFAANMSLA